MNDHNLDDLIIDTIEPQNNKAKSFLTIIALIIVVVIIGIIFYRSILDDSHTHPAALEKNPAELISPELTLQSTPKVKAPKEETKLSSMIEEKLTAPAKNSEVKKETLEITKETAAPAEPAVSSVPKTPEVSAPAAAEETKNEVPAPVKVPAARTPETKPAPVEKVVVPKKLSHKAPTAEKVVVPVPKHTAPAAKGSYYIQVGSFSQTPSTRFLNTIKKHGFSYKITPPTANGTKKLLIGPYPSRTAADHALVRVKDRINKGAFIVKK